MNTASDMSSLYDLSNFYAALHIFSWLPVALWRILSFYFLLPILLLLGTNPPPHPILRRSCGIDFRYSIPVYSIFQTCTISSKQNLKTRYGSPPTQPLWFQPSRLLPPTPHRFFWHSRHHQAHLAGLLKALLIIINLRSCRFQSWAAGSCG
jgi:hypothetical protein